MFEREPGLNPERALWCEVLLRTVEDALLGIPSSHGNATPEQRARTCQEARDYLTRPSKDLSTVCTLAGLNMQAVIDRMRKKIAEAPSPEELAEGHRQNGTSLGKRERGKPKGQRIPFRDQPFTIRGETKAAAEWCERFGIRLTLARSRISKGWEPECAFTLTSAERRAEQRTKTRLIFNSVERSRLIKEGLARAAASGRKLKRGTTGQHYEYNGESHTLTDWSRITGIGKDTLVKRLSMGWSFNEAIETPVRKKAA